MNDEPDNLLCPSCKDFVGPTMPDPTYICNILYHTACADELELIEGEDDEQFVYE